MISVEEAIKAIDTVSIQKKEKYLHLNAELLGKVLSKPIYAPFDLPRFDVSAMDGYAVRFGNTTDFSLRNEEITAGEEKRFSLNPGEAIRIFTGAPRPKDADAVIIQEQTKIKENRLWTEKEIKPEQNIRAAGEEIKKGQLVLTKGQVVNAATVGLLANLGIDKVWVYQPPDCGVLTTGNELIAPGKPLKQGKIYDSNSYMLLAFLRSQNLLNQYDTHVPDDFEQTKIKIREALDKNDIVLISGGISVGDYDFVKRALTENGVEEIFYKVKQKPGKPLFFGKKGQTFVFGLPGNPASALSNAYLYVWPLINRFKGKKQTHLKRSTCTSASDFQKKKGRAQFLKANFFEEKVRVLEGQGSAMLQSFVVADALIYLPSESVGIKEGDKVEVIDLR